MTTAKPHWLPEIPNGWQLIPLKRLCAIETGTADTQDADPNGMYDFVIRSPHLKRASNYTFDCEAIVTAGDGAVGEVFHHLNGRFLAHQRTYVLHSFKEIEARYLFYYFSSHFRFMCQDGSAKTTVDSVRRWMLTDMPILFPPKEQQGRIASFLDTETAKIDHLISRQSAWKDLMTEHLFSVTYQTFSKVIDGAEMKRLKWILTKLRRPVTNDVEVVTAYDDGEVTLRSNRRLDGYWMSSDESNYQGVRRGDFVFHGLDGYRGAVGISDSDGKMSPACHVCAVSPVIRADFLALYLRFLGDSGYLKSQSMTVRGDSMDFRNWQKVAALEVPVPNLRIQRKCVEKLVDLKHRVSAIEETSNRMITLLQARRSAMITAAVTGQIEV